jgi:hypothetical protein
MAEKPPGGAGSDSSARHGRSDRRGLRSGPPAAPADGRPARPLRSSGPSGPARPTRSARPARPTRYPLRGTAALAAALLLLGGLEIHAAGESHDLVAGLPSHPQDVYFLGASHPVQPPHTETATAAQRPFCAVCLNSLQGRGVRPAPAARLSSPLAAQPLPPVAAVSPRRQARRPDGGRAPPLA